MANDGSKVEVRTEQVIIDRVRYFFHFQTPSTIKCTDEVTFHNKGEEILIVEYPIGSFRPFLHVSDSNGKQLEFYGENDKSIGKIYILFPKENPISKGEYRTIRVEYISEGNAKEKSKITYFDIPLNETASVYVFIRQCENYEFNVHYWVLDQKNHRMDNPDLIAGKGDTFLHIYSKAKKDKGLMQIRIEHEIQKPLLTWIHLGLFCGAALVLTLLILYFKEPTNIALLVPIAIVVMTILFFIKGWLFAKNMDVQFRGLDRAYLIIIYLLLFEVLVMIIDFSLNKKQYIS